jgi:cell wall assembly regulator SMI1
MWQDRLVEIAEFKRQFNQELNRGATQEAIARLEKAMREKFNITLPKAYLDALSVINGLEFNGYIVYGIDEELLDENPAQHISGLIDSNKVWHEVEGQEAYLFLGESHMDLLAYRLDNGKYFNMDRSSGDEVDEFESFDLMIDENLYYALL